MLSIDPKIIIEFVNIFSVILITIILAVVIFILIKINRNLDKKIKEQQEKVEKYEVKLKKIQTLKPTEENLDSLNQIAREFFKEKFNLKQSSTYLELAKQFEKDKKKENQEFCEKMSELIYSGRKIKQGEIKKVIDLFSKVLISSKDM